MQKPKTDPRQQRQQEMLDRAMMIATPGCLGVAASRGSWKFARHLQLMDRIITDFVHRNQRGEDVPRILLIDAAPRHGKSEYVSHYLSAWFRGTYPDKHCFITTYSSSFAAEWGAKSRDTFHQFVDEDCTTTVGDLFNLRIDPNNRKSNHWMFEGHQGITRTAGVRGPIVGKGAHCFPIGTPVETEIGTIDIATLSRLYYPPRVLSVDKSGQLCYRRIIATSIRLEGEIYVIRTEKGRVIRTTGEHPFRSTRGDVLAKDLQAGMRLVDLAMHNLQPGVSPTSKRGGQTVPKGSRQFRLLQEVQRRTPADHLRYTLSEVQTGDPATEEILRRLQTIDVRTVHSSPTAHLSCLRGALPTHIAQDRNVQRSLCQQTSLTTDAVQEELELASWRILHQALRPLDPASHATGQVEVCGVQRVRPLPPADAPHQPRQERRPTGEPHHALQILSHHTPQISEDTVSSVTRTRGEPIEVFDIQVEETNCFFAHGVCVHNCFIIDDALKDDEEALSPTIRENTWQWFLGTVLTRLEPDGGCLIMMATRWHREDPTGRVLKLAEDGRFEPVLHIHLPALPEPHVDPIPDTLGRGPNQPLWPERFSLRSLQRIRRSQSTYWWNAQYQGRPTSSEQVEWPDSYFGDHIWVDEEHWPALGDFSLRIAFVDPSKGKRTYRPGDPSAIVFAGVKGNLIYVDADIETRTTEKIVQDTLLFLDRYRPDLAGFEANGFQELLAVQLEQVTQNQFGLKYHVFMLENTTNKVNRIRKLDPYLKNHELRFRMTPGCRIMVDQLRDFPLGRHDDGPDGLEACLRLPIAANWVPEPDR